MEDQRQLFATHLIAHWGVPKEICPITTSKIQPLAIFSFGPRGKRQTWRYATNGMSGVVQNDSEPEIRTELFLGTAAPAPWALDLLIALARYPSDYSTYLSQWDTINVGQPVDQVNSPYTAVLLTPPEPWDVATLGVVGALQNCVLLHRVVAILPSELEYSLQHGGEALWTRLAEGDEPCIDQHRTPVA